MAITRFLDREERIDQERLEAERRWQRRVQTGAHVDHDRMTAWLDGLAARADDMTRRRRQDRSEATRELSMVRPGARPYPER
jgi:hypothetical protein